MDDVSIFYFRHRPYEVYLKEQVKAKENMFVQPDILVDQSHYKKAKSIVNSGGSGAHRFCPEPDAGLSRLHQVL